MHCRQTLLGGALAAALLFSHQGTAAEASSAFDGNWDVILNCPPHDGEDDAKGYTHRFSAEIHDGVLRGTHGLEGQPSWHLLTGRVAPDGSAALRLEGIVGNPDYAINNATRGKPYAYRVRAMFESFSGTGQRMGRRACDFQFRKR